MFDDLIIILIGLGRSGASLLHAVDSHVYSIHSNENFFFFFFLVVVVGWPGLFFFLFQLYIYMFVCLFIYSVNKKLRFHY